ncbi:hypothetical protein [Hazenella coriacea]|uniref:hypothetical protein n=1 Tax=Hazenella coriacea TaxID=1179467 RepID=UPI00104F8BBC|nr:hypothetical protein [Hazenella coriacea]
MSKWRIDLANLKSWFTLVPIIYVSFLILVILLDESILLASYNETAIFPLIVILSVLFFQKEFGGSSMEVIATFPISMTGMWLRKMFLTLFTFVCFHWMVVQVFMLMYPKTVSSYFPYDGGESKTIIMDYGQLLFQIFPAALLLSTCTICAMILSKRLYVGLIFGFGVWMIDVLSSGSIFTLFTLHTVYLPKGSFFLYNRLALLSISGIFIGLSLYMIRKRSYWIVSDEFE